MATSSDRPAAQTSGQSAESGPVSASSPAAANRALLPSEVSSAAASAQRSSMAIEYDISKLQREEEILRNNFAVKQSLLQSRLLIKQTNPDANPDIDNLIATTRVEITELESRLINTETLLTDYRNQLGFQNVSPAQLNPVPPASGPATGLPTPEIRFEDRTVTTVIAKPATTDSNSIPATETPPPVTDLSPLQETLGNGGDSEGPSASGGVYVIPTVLDLDRREPVYDESPEVAEQELNREFYRQRAIDEAAPYRSNPQALGADTDPGLIPERQLFADGEFPAIAPGASAVDTTASPNNAGPASPALVTSAVTDWRFRISLAQSAQYLYNISRPSGDILFPLKATNGVIFPYTPKIDVTYTATYDATDITHTNYKFYNYRNSSVDTISISGEFTAQDTAEANYVLAVIHFFRSVTKMWYGNDANPRAGTPPPLVYLTGHGSYAFNMHPVVITSFSLSYPTDVDYINAGVLGGQGRTIPQYRRPIVGRPSVIDRLRNSNLPPNGVRTANTVYNVSGSVDTAASTRIPTRLTINLTALPVVTRNTISNRFSLQDYATGKLLRGNIERGNGGGIW